MNKLRNSFHHKGWVAVLLLLAMLSGCCKDGEGLDTLPSVTSTNPVNLAVGVPINQKLTATFSEAMDASTINASSFTVVDSVNAPVAGTVAFNKATNTATFTPASDLAVTSLYKATIKNTAASSSGFAMEKNYVWSFTTAVTADTTAPTVISTSPTNTSVGVAINQNVTALFSEALAPASVNAFSFTLKNGGASVAGVASVLGDTVTFNPAANLLPSTLYTATLTTAVTDLASPANHLAADYVWTFTTAAVIDISPPTVLSTNPANLAIDVVVNQNMIAIFSEALSPASVNATSFTVMNGGTPVAGVVTLVGDTVTFNPNIDLANSTLYTATLTTAITDLASPANNLAANYVWTFTTVALADTTPPTVLSTIPANLAIDVAVDANMSAKFSEALSPASVNATSFTVMNGGTPVAGVVTLVGDTVTFNPNIDLANSTLYTATLTTAITDQASPANNLAANYVWTFTTKAKVIPIPVVTSTNPMDLAINVPINQVVTATFSEPMDWATLTSFTFNIIGSGEPAMVGPITYDAGTNTVMFTPTSDFTSDKLYVATITTGVQSLEGAALASDHVWSFTTSAALDTTPPTVISTIPVDLATNVAIHKNVSAVFSEALAPLTVNTTSFTLKAGLTSVLGVVTLSGTTATFNPDADLTPDTLYTARLTTAITDLASPANNLASDYVWTFTTASPIDITPPTVISTNPIDMKKSVALNSNVTALFSEDIDPATVDTLSFTLKNGFLPVAGLVTSLGANATFNPTVDLLPNTVYTATLTTAITDLAMPSNNMVLDYVWTFTTAVGPLPVDLLSAEHFVLLTKAGITNVPYSQIYGNIGSSPITAAAMDNVSCFEMKGGTIYGADAAYTGSGDVTCFAGTAADKTLVDLAILDMGTAYGDAKGRTTPDYTELGAGNISGMTLTGGLYKWSSSVDILADVTLSGGENDVWIFQIAGDLTMASAVKIVLAGGALQKNIFWQVEGGAGVVIGTGATFEGIAIVQTKITVNTGATINGRLMAHTAVTLDQNMVTQPAP